MPESQDLPPGILIEQRVYEAVRSIDDIDHEALHFVVIQTRDFRPRDGTVRTADGDIRVIPRCRRRRCAGMEILQHRIAKALQNHVFFKAPLKLADAMFDF
jgi:hypothetical protein